MPAVSRSEQWSKQTPILILAIVLLTPTATAAEQSPTGHCVPGVWDLSTTNAAAAGAMKATSTRYCLFDGTVEMAEYRSFGPNGQLNFAGVSFHAWSPDEDGMLTTLWLMIGDPGFTILPAQVGDDGQLTANGWGEDMQGRFLERSVTTTDDDGNYIFEMERSRDDGATWQPQTRIQGTFRTATPPEYGEALRDRYREIRGSASPATSLIILDGLAEVSTETRQDNGRAVRIIRFSSAYGTPTTPPTWRTIVWRAGERDFETESSGG